MRRCSRGSVATGGHGWYHTGLATRNTNAAKLTIATRESPLACGRPSMYAAHCRLHTRPCQWNCWV